MVFYIIFQSEDMSILKAYICIKMSDKFRIGHVDIKSLAFKTKTGYISNYSEFVMHIGNIRHLVLQYSCLENPMDGGAW